MPYGALAPFTNRQSEARYQISSDLGIYQQTDPCPAVVLCFPLLVWRWWLPRRRTEMASKKAKRRAVVAFSRSLYIWHVMSAPNSTLSCKTARRYIVLRGWYMCMCLLILRLLCIPSPLLLSLLILDRITQTRWDAQLAAPHGGSNTCAATFSLFLVSLRRSKYLSSRVTCSRLAVTLDRSVSGFLVRPATLVHDLHRQGPNHLPTRLDDVYWFTLHLC